MARHDLKDVGEKIQRAVQSYVERGLTKIFDDVERRIGLQLASAGKSQLAIEHLNLAILDLEARADDLERANPVRQATPEECAEHARTWARDFPGSEPPSIWQLEMGQK